MGGVASGAMPEEPAAPREQPNQTHPSVHMEARAC